MTIYLGIFWLAGGIHWLLAAAVAAVVLSVFVALPLAQPVRRLGGRAGGARPLATSVACLAGLAALLPLPAAVIAEGVVLRDGLALIYARADARVVAVAPPGRGDGNVVLRLAQSGNRPPPHPARGRCRGAGDRSATRPCRGRERYRRGGGAAPRRRRAGGVAARGAGRLGRHRASRCRVGAIAGVDTAGRLGTPRR